jgi:hypothetical protein
VEALHLQLRDMAAMGADLAALGFTSQELARALSPTSELFSLFEVSEIRAALVLARRH